MNRLLVVCGPTATGKTNLALHLAKVFDGELVSADSRQVYKGLDIGVGKEWGDGSVRLWGYDLADPKEEFSVSQYLKFAKRAIEEIWEEEKLPILVGGTGLYIKAVVDGIETVNIPPDNVLRKKLGNENADQLFDRLTMLDAKRALSLNESDRKNPRRLVRAIEIAQYKFKVKPVSMYRYIDIKDVLFIGLKSSASELSELIKKRVQKRIRSGVEREIQGLLGRGVNWTNQSMSSQGYKQWEMYFKGRRKKEEVIDEWTREEIKYAKRQITWFKKDKRIKWFDISKDNWRQNVVNLVERWYSKIK